ncbi:MAG: hypothetical protein JW863_23510, partial [Chitinispirillaceae bacterium]|nr:hypothetical protein [Chitinispirillaceae bacterium]
SGERRGEEGCSRSAGRGDEVRRQAKTTGTFIVPKWDWQSNLFKESSMSTNPFFYGRTVSGSAFIDREEEITEITSSLKRGQSVILFSPRRYGKTSLIKQVFADLESNGLLVFYLDLYRITSLERFAAYYSQTVLSSLRSGADKIFSLVKALLPSLKPKLTYTEPNLPSIELELTLEALRKQSTLPEMFDFLEKYCNKKKLRGCVVFDEFQEISGFDVDRRLEREMRSAIQHHTSVSYAFLGSKMHLMRELFRDKNRPFYNFGKHVELGTIDAKHWIPFIKAGLKNTGSSFTSEECRRIIVLTGGHPYYTQMICSELWEQAVHCGAADVGDLIDGALQAVFARENHAFIEIWDALSPAERRLLCALAEKEDTALFATEFLQQYRLGAASSVQRVVERLSKKGIIDRTGKGYRIIDPVFTHWIMREDQPEL